MPWIGAVVGAGVGLIGDVMSQQGQQQTNAMTMGMQTQAENWMAGMSDTAMVRRVADLKAAGLNPMLAIGQGGASTPGIGNPGSIGNPNAAFGNMGMQASNAIQAGAQMAGTQSQIGLNQANAAKANADAQLSQAQANKASGVDTDVGRATIGNMAVQQELMRAQTQAAQATASLDRASAQVAQERIPEIQANIALLGASKSVQEQQAALTKLQSSMQGLSIAQFQSISPSLITSAANAARTSTLDVTTALANQQRAVKEGQMYAGDFGSFMTYANAIANWFHLGANIAVK